MESTVTIYRYVDHDEPRWVKYWERIKRMHVPTMTREEFIAQYFGEGLPQEIIDKVMKRRTVEPCDCDYLHCLGWKMVRAEDE